MRTVRMSLWRTPISKKRHFGSRIEEEAREQAANIVRPPASPKIQPPPQAPAPVVVSATAGTMGPSNYASLGAAFTAINAGTHQGDITVDIVSNTTESGSDVLNSSGAGSASYVDLDSSG